MRRLWQRLVALLKRRPKLPVLPPKPGVLEGPDGRAIELRRQVK